MDWRQLLGEAVAAQHDGRFGDALQLCDRAAMSGDEARYFAALMRGDVLLDLGDPAGALSSYDSVAEPSVPDPELDCARGVALFELARFPEAENALRSALRGDATIAQAHYTLGLIAEILGNGREMEHFRQARRLDPEAFSPTARLSHEEFQAAVDQALLDLPVPVRDATRSIPVLIAEIPQLSDLTQNRPPLSPTLLGLFVGPMPQDTSVLDPPAEQQPMILLFKRNLERTCPDRETLMREIRATVAHEVGHAIGLSEADLARLGLD